jgi:hypothetical protein
MQERQEELVRQECVGGLDTPKQVRVRRERERHDVDAAREGDSGREEEVWEHVAFVREDTENPCSAQRKPMAG